jgi:hypothetical protein
MTSSVDLPGNVSSNRLPPPTVYVEPTWEYKHLVRTLKAEGPPEEGELNTLGADGWELAGAFVEHGHLHVYFKRLAR